ncbi:MAG: ATP-binding protein [Patescibacteria group bacterium]
MEILKRSITQKLINSLEDTPVVIINGARQVGKSTLVKELIDQSILSEYITLDNLSVLGALRQSPKNFLSRLKHGTVINEIQKSPEVFPVIKEIIDQDRKPGRFLLTGSANIFMLPKISESLAGRMEVITLHPFTQGEILKTKEVFVDQIVEGSISTSSYKDDSSRIIDQVLTGGFPELLSRKPERRRSWVDNYTSALVQRDVFDISNVQDITALPRILLTLADQTGNLLNVSNMARTIGMKRVTLIRYLAILQTLFLTFELQPYSHRNITKRLVKSPKVYLNDSGLASQLLRVDTEKLSNPVEYGIYFGKLLETYIVTQIKRQITWSKSNPSMYYLRSEDGGREVDIVLEYSGNKIFGIEIKATKSPNADDWKHLVWLKEQNSHCIGGAVLYLGDQLLEVKEDIWMIPISCLWNGEGNVNSNKL